MSVADDSRPFTPTPEQAPIISHRGGHLQIIACAGSGKTETMAQRVASLIIEGSKPESIVAFTFTERAADSLKSRILKRVAERMGADFIGRLAPMYVGTIHGYCFRLLQNHVPRYENYDVLDEHQHAALLSREHRRLKLDDLGDRHWRPIHDFKRNADVVENELIDPNQLVETKFGICYANYCKRLEDYRFLTFGQLIALAVQALEDPTIFAKVHAPLEHLIVDEYQDVNPAQEKLIQLLAKRPVHLCVVGDDDQAIYQWRGSDVENIQTFVRRYRANRFPLSTNRRSKPKIIEVAAKFSQTIKPRLRKEMLDHRPGGGPETCYWESETPQSEARTIAATIKRLISKGFKPGNIAILLRSVRTSSPPIIDALNAARIPYRCAGRTGLFLQPDAQLLGKTFAWLLDRGWKTDRWGTEEPVTGDALTDEYRRLFGLADTRPLKRRLFSWKTDANNENRTANLIREYYVLLRTLGIHHWQLSEAPNVARLGSLARFSYLLRDFEHVNRRSRWVEENGDKTFRGGHSRGIWYYRRLFNYIQYYALDAYEDFDGEEDFETDTVDILTIHQAKGLEWPIVFMPCLVSRRFPSAKTGSPGNWLLSSKVFPGTKRKRYEGTETDERRLFYVGMTRARDTLYLSCFKRQQNRVAPSPFLCIVSGDIPETSETLSIPEYAAAKSEEQEKPTLTFSDLAAYENCPFSYRLGALIGFQPQIAQELGYGRAVHHVLRRIADRAIADSRIPTASEVERILSEEFYLPFAGRIAFDELRKAAHTLVARYLHDYSDDLFRIWDTERPFELQLDNSRVAGRADVILDREDGVIAAMALVDYKTAADPKAKNVYEFQLAIYSAAGREEGLNMRAAYIHDLKEGIRLPVIVDSSRTDAAKERAQRLVGKIAAKKFDPTPEASKCVRCDTRLVCRHGPADGAAVQAE